MITLLLRSLELFEQFVIWVRDRQNTLFREKIKQEAADAIAVAKAKKDTSKIDQMWNSGTSSQ